MLVLLYDVVIVVVQTMNGSYEQARKIPEIFSIGNTNDDDDAHDQVCGFFQRLSRTFVESE